MLSNKRIIHLHSGRSIEDDADRFKDHDGYVVYQNGWFKTEKLYEHQITEDSEEYPAGEVFAVGLSLTVIILLVLGYIFSQLSNSQAQTDPPPTEDEAAIAGPLFTVNASSSPSLMSCTEDLQAITARITEQDFVFQKPRGKKQQTEPDAQVALMQDLLAAHGYPVTSDGWFGEETDKAVRSFQNNNGLGADGGVGGETWRLLMDKSECPLE